MESKDGKDNQKIGSSPGRLRSSRWLRGGIIAVIFLCIAGWAVVAYLRIRGPAVMADCDWSVNLFTWVDVNADGIFQEGEPPLPGVNILMDDVRSGVTDSEGQTGFGASFYGCPDMNFKITAEEPAGYRLTTAGTQFGKKHKYHQSFQFGFTYLPGVPTLTPGPEPQMSCEIVPEFTGEIVYSIAPDKGGLWVASSGKVARLDFSTNEWENYPGEKAYAGEARRIFVGPDEGVWLVTWENVYRLNEEKWEKFSPEVLRGKEVSSIAWAPNGNVWFFRQWDPGIIIWDPHTNVWTSDESDAYLADVLFASDGKDIRLDSKGGAIAPDGKVWGVIKAGKYYWEGDYYDPATHKITESPTYYDCYSDMKFNKQGGMWLATCNAGLLYIPDPIQGARAGWYDYHHDAGFVSDFVFDLFLQGDNLLWVGTDQGLARCQIETHSR